MIIDTIKHLGAEFHRAADSLADTLARLDNARLDRLAFLRRCSKESTARLAAIKEELRALPVIFMTRAPSVAALRAAEDLLRRALEPAQEQPKPEPYRAGLPPERLRKVWAEWEEKDSGLVDFRGNEYRGTMGDGSRDWRWRPMAELGGFADVKLWAFRPHSATWARVEAMADAAEKPTLLDLTKLPPGTVCEATKFFGIYNSGIMLNAGDRFCVVAQADGDLPVLIEVGGKDWWLSALVPARVVKEGGEQ